MESLENSLKRGLFGLRPLALLVLRNVLPPNGSRLSCGRNACGRKAVEPQIKGLASEATQFFPTGERPPASRAC